MPANLTRVVGLEIEPPFRLDLTVAILRRFETNAVDRFTAGGDFVRAFGTRGDDPIVVVRQLRDDALSLQIEGDADAASFVPSVRRMLGLDVDVAPFAERASRVAWLKPVMAIMRGVRPPRYPSLWEACVNAVVFQQVSIASASAMLRRVIVATTQPRSGAGETVHPFPPAATIAAVPLETLTHNGLSLAKAATVKRIAAAILDGSLSEAQLAPLSSAEISGHLQAHKGIGPWTAAIILLRGFGRLDVFPEGDSGAARSLQMLAPGVDAGAVQEARAVLGDCEGLLYYTLLMGRLAARGIVQP